MRKGNVLEVETAQPGSEQTKQIRPKHPGEMDAPGRKEKEKRNRQRWKAPSWELQTHGTRKSSGIGGIEAAFLSCSLESEIVPWGE